MHKEAKVMVLRVAGNESGLTEVDLQGFRLLALRCNADVDTAAGAVAWAFEGNTTVTKLWLGQSGIGEGRAKSLAEMVKHNHAITTLVLSFNNAGDIGGKAMAEALKINSTTTTLDLNSNITGDTGGKAMVEALKINSTTTELRMGNNYISKELWQTIDALVDTPGAERVAAAASGDIMSPGIERAVIRWARRWRAPSTISSCWAIGRMATLMGSLSVIWMRSSCDFTLSARTGASGRRRWRRWKETGGQEYWRRCSRRRSSRGRRGDMKFIGSEIIASGRRWWRRWKDTGGQQHWRRCRRRRSSRGRRGNSGSVCSENTGRRRECGGRGEPSN
jgi:hypothetical protein